MNIAFFDTKAYDIPGFRRYLAGTGLHVKFFDTRLRADTAALAQGCAGVCLFVNDAVDAATAQALYQAGVRVLALRCAGYNNVDLDACRGKIAVFRVPVYSPYAVAEHAMAMLLTLIRRTHRAYNRTREFNFSLSGLVGFDLHGRTAGIVGTGRIGRAFGAICRGFGMEVLSYDRCPDEAMAWAPLPELLRRCDVVSLHCPLTEQTRHLINREALRQMKPGAILINTSRGALVDTDALIDALREKRLGGACLDVYEEEHDLFYEDNSGRIIYDDNLVRLLSLPNVLLTSHQAFLTEEALDAIAAVTVDNLLRFFQGNPNPDTRVV